MGLAGLVFCIEPVYDMLLPPNARPASPCSNRSGKYSSGPSSPSGFAMDKPMVALRPEFDPNASATQYQFVVSAIEPKRELVGPDAARPGARQLETEFPTIHNHRCLVRRGRIDDGSAALAGFRAVVLWRSRLGVAGCAVRGR